MISTETSKSIDVLEVSVDSLESTEIYNIDFIVAHYTFSKRVII